jgi:hypothetical protein
MPPPKIPSVQARAWREEGVGGRNPATPERKKKVASPVALLVRAEQHKKVFFSFQKKKSGARKSGKAKKTFLWGGER